MQLRGRRPLLHENDLKLRMYLWSKWSVLLAWVVDKLKSKKTAKRTRVQEIWRHTCNSTTCHARSGYQASKLKLKKAPHNLCDMFIFDREYLRGRTNTMYAVK